MQRLNKIIDYIGLSSIGILSLGYLVYYRKFAKLYIYLSFINSPFFIGEMVFIICFFLFLLKWLKNLNNFNIFTWVFVSYLAFVATKTLVGYFSWGPLSLRHSVLFCYPLFAVFSYSFYRKDFFKPSIRLFLIIFFLLSFVFPYFYLYFGLTCLALALVLLNTYPKKPSTYILYLLVLILFPYRYVFNTSRTFMVGNLIAMVYVGFGFSYILKIKKIYKYIFCLLFIFLTLYGLSKHSNPRELRSIVGFEKLKKSYDETKMLLRAYEPTFVEPNVGLRLFNAERDTFKTVSSIAGANNFDNRNAVLRRPVVPKVAVDTVAKKGISYNKVIQSDSVVTSEKTAYIVDSRKNKESKDDVSNKAEQALERDILERDSGGRYTNILFRLFIWNEAFTELKADYPIFGFAFGKPFRCRTLEILNWGRDEWLNDGWVCLHNSYLDIIYRAGIVGIFIIVCLLVILFSLIRRSFKIRSLTGVLLTGILVNWFVAANFLEILEMPYSAIPIWSLFGLTYSYLFKNKNL